MAEKTIFQRILEGEIPGDFVYRDDRAFAIRDINPAAPVHFLIIPNRPIGSLAEITREDTELVGHLVVVASELAREHGLANGYRIVINTGKHGGQTVPHLHVHLLGGKPMAGHGTA